MSDTPIDLPRDGRLDVVRRPRSWVAWLIGALVVLVVVEAGARVIERTDPPIVRWYDAAAQQKIEMMDTRTADVVFAGTSMAWQDFVPGVFENAVDAANDAANDGIAGEAFNAGLAGAVPVVMQPWLLDQVEPRLEPDVVVWGLSSLDFAPAYGETQLEAYEQAPETRSGALAAADRWAGDVSAFIRLRPLLRRPTELIGGGADEVRADIDEARAIIGPDGERRDFDEDVSDQRRAVIRARLAGFDPDRDDVEAIGETVGELGERGVRVVLVELPVPERFVQLHPNGAADHELTGLAIDRLGADLGVDVVHLDELFTDDDFVDFTHLDESAAVRLTGWFAEALASIDSVPPGTCGELRILDDLGFPLPISACHNRT